MRRPWDCRHVFRFLFKYFAGGVCVRVWECRRCGLTRSRV